MTFREALIAVQSEFCTQYVAPDAYAIRVNRSFNGSELYYIELLLLITDRYTKSEGYAFPPHRKRHYEKT